jgi:hypothetical protein
MVDSRYYPNQRAGTVSHGDAISALLQLSRCLCQITGMGQNSPILTSVQNITLNAMFAVLATFDNVPLLRPLLPRPSIPHIFPPALCAAA